MSTPSLPPAEASPASADADLAPAQQPQGSGQRDAPMNPGIAPAKGEALEADASPRTPDTPPGAPAPPADRTIKNGAVYSTPDGEERLVWEIRNGAVEYFSRRSGGHWTGVQTPPPSIADFASQVGLAAPA